MIYKTIDDTILHTHLKDIARDGIDIFLLQDGAFRGAIAHGTTMLNHMRANHKLGIAESLVLGHAYMAAGLMTSMVKGKDRIIFDMTCDGPAAGLSVEANAEGHIRGYLKTDRIDIHDEVTSFDTSQFIGTGGTLSVSRFLEGASEPVTGHIAIEAGGIAGDLARYFTISEQTPTALSVSVQFDKDGRIVGAGGLFIQALPTAYDSERIELDELVRSIDSLGESFRQGETGAHIVNTRFAEYVPELIGTRDLRFECSCSKERFSRYIATLHDDDVQDILQNGPFPLVTTCHNCGTDYAFSLDELKLLWKDRV